MNIKITAIIIGVVIFSVAMLTFGQGFFTKGSDAVSYNGMAIREKPNPVVGKTNMVTEVSAIAEPTPIMAEVSAKKSTPKSENSLIETASISNDRVWNGEKRTKTDAEWKKLLTANEYHIMREAGTETAYTGTLLDNKKIGVYICGACHLHLFDSATKFESGTGWPSFYQPINQKNVLEKMDNSLGDERIEVICPRCGAHLGHVFDDGPEPTGLRYCINSAALKFIAKR